MKIIWSISKLSAISRTNQVYYYVQNNSYFLFYLTMKAGNKTLHSCHAFYEGLCVIWLTQPHTGKYGPEKTPYLDTFHAVSTTRKLSISEHFFRNRSRLLILDFTHQAREFWNSEIWNRVICCVYSKLTRKISQQHYPEVATGVFHKKKQFLKVSQYSQEIACVGVSF